MKLQKRRKINVKNCYIIIVSVLAFVSLIGNLYQDHFYNQALQVQQDTITQLAQDSNNSNNIMYAR